MIYLDHHAATPLAPEVRAAMARAHELAWANPESVHRAGRAARALREQTRARVAEVLQVKAADIVLAGSGSEALNLALLGIARARRAATGATRVIISAVEHPAVAASAAQLAREGFECVALVPAEGRAFGCDELAAALQTPSACVALQWVNHETGHIWPIAAYAEQCAQAGAPLIVDACQALGKLAIDLGALPGVSALVVAAAKIGGPAGVSALYHARPQELSPVLFGGAQERGFRPGTPDVAALAGFEAALAALPARISAQPEVGGLRDQLEARAVALGGLANVAGARVATVSNVSFRGVRADVLVAALDVEGLCVSAGAACSSGLAAPSPVLRAMYADSPWRAESALRFSLGPETSAPEVSAAADILARVLARMPRA
jgi:cysteine desulfurase